MAGVRRFASTNKTLLPIAAAVWAKYNPIVDLPSSGAAETIARERIVPLISRKETFV
ncbi:hypothetical protein [Chroococcidiopsis sp. SAG 2025]|uniref:hypothetical protein n=1 Tax=Chroococcidiopsis sp. SAG 2025 TaxID=171389 RepID=UPI0029373E5B|nr:hypothetical protein [Chroococcidiopsis sp. SAG 2025]